MDILYMLLTPVGDLRTPHFLNGGYNFVKPAVYFFNLKQEPHQKGQRKTCASWLDLNAALSIRYRVTVFQSSPNRGMYNWGYSHTNVL